MGNSASVGKVQTIGTRKDFIFTLKVGVLGRGCEARPRLPRQTNPNLFAFRPCYLLHSPAHRCPEKPAWHGGAAGAPWG